MPFRLPLSTVKALQGLFNTATSLLSGVTTIKLLEWAFALNLAKGLEKSCRIRYRHNCVGFRSDFANAMFTTDKFGKEKLVLTESHGLGSIQGVQYDKVKNCVRRISGNYTGNCIDLPDHFAGKRVRAVGQVWGGNRAIVM